MTAGIHISSTKFPILPGEEEKLVNEGTYGKALAEYLAAKLRERGWDVPFVCCEDWGWWVSVKGQPFELGLCCYGASYQRHQVSTRGIHGYEQSEVMRPVSAVRRRQAVAAASTMAL